MKNKTIETIVLILGLLVISSAVFLMYYDKNGTAAKSINLIFSTGFIIYITYSYLLSRNLNRDITELNKIVSNLKDEVNRLQQTIVKREQTITQQKEEISDLSQQMASVKTELESKNAALKKAESRITELEAEAKPED